MRRLNSNFADASNSIENQRPRRFLNDNYYSFMDKYDFTKGVICRWPDIRLAKFVLILEDIAKGKIKVKDKRHISKLFNELEQN